MSHTAPPLFSCFSCSMGCHRNLDCYAAFAHAHILSAHMIQLAWVVQLRNTSLGSPDDQRQLRWLEISLMHFTMSMSASGCPLILMLNAELWANVLGAVLCFDRHGTAALASCIESASCVLCGDALLQALDAAAGDCFWRTLAACFGCKSAICASLLTGVVCKGGVAAAAALLLMCCASPTGDPSLGDGRASCGCCACIRMAARRLSPASCALATSLCEELLLLLCAW